MVAVAEREPILVSDDEEAAVRELDARLAALPNAILVGADGVGIRLPGAVYGLLRQLVHELARGKAVTIVPVHVELTTQQAADLLNVSRPFLVKLLEAGEIPFHRVGAHRRVRFQDVIAYRRRRGQERRHALAELLREAQEAGLYDDEYESQPGDGEQGRT